VLQPAVAVQPASSRDQVIAPAQRSDTLTSSTVLRAEERAPVNQRPRQETRTRRPSMLPTGVDARAGKTRGARSRDGSKSGESMKRRYDLLEIFLIGILIGVVAFRFGAWRGIEATRPPWQHPDDRTMLDKLQRRYGPNHFSGHAEEWIVRDFFNNSRRGIFADIGASDWRDGSNTYVLERDLGWTGLAVDAAPGYADGWRRHRRATFVQAMVAETDGERRTLNFLPEQPGMSSVSDAHTRLFAGTPKVVNVTTAKLDTLLERAALKQLDFLSMDIEGSEPAALEGFSIARFRPRFVCIEALPPVRQLILNYFAEAGYVLVGKYQHADPWNLYFMPRKAAGLEQ
jgi:FkbM family methyltransferase